MERHDFKSKDNSYYPTIIEKIQIIISFIQSKNFQKKDRNKILEIIDGTSCIFLDDTNKIRINFKRASFNQINEIYNIISKSKTF